MQEGKGWIHTSLSVFSIEEKKMLRQNDLVLNFFDLNLFFWLKSILRYERKHGKYFGKRKYNKKLYNKDVVKAPSKSIFDRS